MKITNYTLVPYTDKDYNFIYETKKQAYKTYVEQNYGAWVEQDQLEMFKTFIEDRKNNIQIITLDNKQIGFVDGKVVSNTLYEQGNICVVPEYQNKGIGTHYLTTLINSHPDKNISLRVFKQNPAQNLYKRLGFEITGETKTHFNMMKKSK